MNIKNKKNVQNIIPDQMSGKIVGNKSEMEVSENLGLTPSFTVNYLDNFNFEIEYWIRKCKLL